MRALITKKEITDNALYNKHQYQKQQMSAIVRNVLLTINQHMTMSRNKAHIAMKHNKDKQSIQQRTTVKGRQK